MTGPSSDSELSYGLEIRGEGRLTNLPGGESSPLHEMVSRSLVHLQTKTALEARHRLGGHLLCGPDYRLLCAMAEDVGMTPEDVLEALEVYSTEYDETRTKIVEGRFISLVIPRKEVPISVFPSAEGSAIVSHNLSGLDLTELSVVAHQRVGADRDRFTKLSLSVVPHLTSLRCNFNKFSELDLSRVPLLTSLSCISNKLRELDLSAVPHLTKLSCGGNQLTELDLSAVPHLTVLGCGRNQLTELDLSAVPHLTVLNCYGNPLTELDLRAVPDLTELWCSSNHLTKLDLSPIPDLTGLLCDSNELTELDLSAVPDLRALSCESNQLTELDIRPLIRLECLVYDKQKTKLIQRPDQHF